MAGWYRRGKGFHTLASRVSHQNSIFKPSSRILQSGFLNSCSKGAIFNGFSSFSSISNRFSTRGFEINKSFMRFYSVDPKNVQHCCNCSPKKGWFHKLRHVFIVGSVVSGVLLLYFGNMETIPYTNRTHLILVPKVVERWIGEISVEKKKVEWKGKLLPERHPESIKVRMIGNNIIDALKKKKKGGLHLDGFNWEFLVVDGPVWACCLAGGKIVVYTGMLKYFRSNAEIATILGHEVGHVVARHIAEESTRNLGFFILQLILYPFITPDLFKEMWSLFVKLPKLRRNEIEADYIGLLLLASAGYDPRVAPKVYEKFRQIIGDSTDKDYLSTHPSCKKRASLLAQAQVMEEALTIYENGRAGQGFLHDCYNYFVKLYRNS